ncbi:chalcone isomerase family protein [Glaciecola sp.]|nr:chalcone isomerase family protein [Glaciecola sp.]
MKLKMILMLSLATFGAVSFIGSVSLAHAQAKVQVSMSANDGVTIPAFIEKDLLAARVVGQSRLTMYFFKIYDATLYAPLGQFDKSKPFALSLAYLRDFDGADIAERSVDEMQDLGYTNNEQLTRWLVQMEQAFPNIVKGDVLTGMVDEQQHTQFYFNGEATYKISDPLFTQAFFAIWLDDNTSQPKMRKQLLGQSK